MKTNPNYQYSFVIIIILLLAMVLPPFLLVYGMLACDLTGSPMVTQPVSDTGQGDLCSLMATYPEAVNWFMTATRPGQALALLLAACAGLFFLYCLYAGLRDMRRFADRLFLKATGHDEYS